MMRFLLPLGVFLAIVIALAAGLRHDPRELPSSLVGKPAPAFVLPVLETSANANAQKFDPASLRGKVWVLNVWASWCTACRAEHPVLLGMAGQTQVPLYGLNYKDTRGAALEWLRRMGDPYKASAVDADGRVGIDLGVYGVPETFIIDAAGVVRYRQVGPVTQQVLEQKLLPLLKSLENGGSRA
ncbi:DsbE family thiol:disulfide interchange protein [Cupriavidus metallidurans]|uniref:DsbE family thiol:disulfide interchange protein n=1 Tax=Cupriavidus metallidurans TaxID=119219 RepID=UPI001CCA9DD6|nr:DsbE family thiol:disulfide interchange protein [Cupriavidus metallidurans]UBM07440.1 DsbE family thiol:disulfide interchange protein [Cupriavidus metallidurans]